MKDIRLRHILWGIIQGAIIMALVHFLVPGDPRAAQERGITWMLPLVFLAGVTGFAWCNLKSEEWHKRRRSGK